MRKGVRQLKLWFSVFDDAVPPLIIAFHGASVALVFFLPELLSASGPLSGLDGAFLGLTLVCSVATTACIFALPELVSGRQEAFLNASHLNAPSVLTILGPRCSLTNGAALADVNSSFQSDEKFQQTPT